MAKVRKTEPFSIRLDVRVFDIVETYRTYWCKKDDVTIGRSTVIERALREFFAAELMSGMGTDEDD